MAIASGRRITVVATRCQAPSPTAGAAARWKTAHLFTRGPSTASSAGSTTTAPTAAISAAAMPA